MCVYSGYVSAPLCCSFPLCVIEHVEAPNAFPPAHHTGEWATQQYSTVQLCTFLYSYVHSCTAVRTLEISTAVVFLILTFS